MSLTRVVFLCTGNSCRSQMAEGYARALGDGIIEAQSAGIEAHGQNPRAIAVMAEAGIDISSQQSTRLTEAMLAWADRVVTVCGHADESCPVLPPGTQKEHWPLADPAKATGTEAQIMTTFRATREEVKHRVTAFLERLRTASNESQPGTGDQATSSRSPRLS
ncbi:MAG: arsenate reductase ArsC [Gammaproteobacteria bacterium]